MRTFILTVSVVLTICSSAFGVDCTLTPGSPTSINGQFTGPLRSLSPIEAEQQQRFFPGLSFTQGEGPVELQLEYCGAFGLEGDFSEHPFWEFGSVGWVMIGSPDNETSLLGNILDPSPTSSVFLSERVSSTNEDIGGNAFRTNGLFDISGLEPGQYLVGAVGTYTFADVVVGQPDIRLREDRDFEYGFPLTIVPEPSASMTFLVGLFFALHTTRRRGVSTKKSHAIHHPFPPKTNCPC